MSPVTRAQRDAQEAQLVRLRDRVASLVADARQERLHAQRASSPGEQARRRAAARRLLDQAKRHLRQMERLAARLS